MVLIIFMVWFNQYVPTLQYICRVQDIDLQYYMSELCVPSLVVKFIFSILVAWFA